jgi:hypothetical protein
MSIRKTNSDHYNTPENYLALIGIYPRDYCEKIGKTELEIEKMLSLGDFSGEETVNKISEATGITITELMRNEVHYNRFLEIFEMMDEAEKSEAILRKLVFKYTVH